MRNQYFQTKKKLEQTILERIAARDGELTRDKIIDWDKEVNEYVATELHSLSLS